MITKINFFIVNKTFQIIIIKSTKSKYCLLCHKDGHLIEDFYFYNLPSLIKIEIIKIKILTNSKKKKKKKKNNLKKKKKKKKKNIKKKKKKKKKKKY